MKRTFSFLFFGRTLFPLAALILLPNILTGCGGSGGSSSSSTSSTSATSSASLTIVWPTQPKAASGAQPALIPLAANSITVTLKSTISTTVAPITRVVNRPTNGGTSTVTLILPADTFMVTATAYPQTGGLGTALASGTGTLTTSLGKTATLAIDMSSTIDHLVVTPAVPLLSIGGTTTVTATALNASGAMVLLSASKLTFTSSNTSVATVSSTGLVKAIKSGSTTITATDSESGKSAKTIEFVAGLSNGGPGSNAGLANSPWPKSLGDVSNTSRGGGQGAVGTLKWTFQGTAGVSSPVIAADGTLYLHSVAPELDAIDGATGTFKWKFVTGGSVTDAAVAADGTIFFGSTDGYLYAINGASGTLKWKYKSGSAAYTSYSSPTIGSDGTVYISSSDKYLYAINGSTGTLKWKFIADSGQPVSMPAISADGTLYVTSSNGNIRDTQGYIYAVDGPTGALRWKSNDAGFGTVPAIGPDGTVYVVSGYDYPQSYGVLAAYDGELGTVKWYFNIGDAGQPAIGSDGTIYVSNSNGLYAVNPASHSEKWNFAGVGASSYSSPAIGSDGTVYIGAYNSFLFAVNGTTGALKWQYTGSSNTPYLFNPVIGADGTVYVGSSSLLSSGSASLYAVQ